MMPRCRWGFSNLFVLLRRELLRITSAALETTPAPEWERSVLLRFAIKSSNNHLYAKHISHCFVSVFETFRRQHTEALKKKRGCSFCSTTCLLSGVTWGKVVSLYAVAGALAVDCVRHGHPAMVHTIVDCMGEFVRKSLTSWLRRRGGWVRSHICANTKCSFPLMCF